MIPLRLWLPVEILASLAGEAQRFAPFETGGVLLGYWGDETGEPVVTDFVGPGPKAKHGRQGFTPDQDFHLTEIARRYAESGRRLHYLGDWHTHPGGAAELSKRDRKTLRRIAAEPEARTPQPVMLVLSPGPRWEPNAWRGRIERTKFWRYTLVLDPMNVELFAKRGNAGRTHQPV